MNAVICPHCDTQLPPQEVTDGWCETCGKKLPVAITDHLTPRRKPEVPYSHSDLRIDAAPSAGFRIRWGYVIGAVISALVGVFMLYMAIADDGPRTGSTSRRGRAFEQALGKRGTEAFAGVVFLGISGFCAFKSFGRK